MRPRHAIHRSPASLLSLLFLLCSFGLTFACSAPSSSGEPNKEAVGTDGGSGTDMQRTEQVPQEKAATDTTAQEPQTDAGERESAPREELRPDNAPSPWQDKTLVLQWDQGVWTKKALPTLTKGKAPYTYKLQGVTKGTFSIDKDMLVGTVPYEESTTPVTLQVVATDSVQQRFVLDVSITSYLPRFEKHTVPGGLFGPGALANPAIAMAQQRVLVFSGYPAQGQGSNALWIYQRSDKKWLRATPKGKVPLAYGAHRIAIDSSDPATKTITGVIYQGMNPGGSTIDAMYRFVLVDRTVTWSRLTATGDAPPASLGLSAFGYDPHNKRFVVFGGLDFSTNQLPTQVWTMSLQGDKAAWTEYKLKNGPVGRYGSLYAMDPTHKRMYIATGDTQRQALERFPNDLWVLDLTGTPKWIEIKTKGAYGGRRNGVLLVDAPSNRIFLWSGSNGISAPTSLSSLSLDDPTPTWTSMPYKGPAPRTSIASASNPSTGFSFLGFGRNPQFVGDLWMLRTHAPKKP